MLARIRNSLKEFFQKFRSLVKVFVYIYKVERLGSVLRIIIFFLSTFLTVYLIKLGGQFIDTTSDLLKTWSSFNLYDYIKTQSFFVLLEILIVSILQLILQKTLTYITFIIRGNLPFDLYTNLIDKVRHLNLEEVENKKIQNLVTYSSSYSFSNMYAVYDNFTKSIAALIQVVSIIVVLYNYIGFKSFLIVVLSLPEVLIFYYRSVKIRNYIDRSISKTKYIQYLETLALNNTYFPELRVDDIFRFILSDRQRVSNSFYKKLFKLQFHKQSDSLLFQVIDQIGIRIFIIYIVALSIISRLTIGKFSALVGYVLSLYNSSVQTFTYFLNSYNSVSYVEKFFDLISYQGFGDRRPGFVKLKRHCPSLEFQSLDFVYPGSEQKVLENVSFKVFPGEKIAIIGKDGAGKSSLVKLLGGLYKINAGDYLIDSYSIRELARGELKKKISVLYQDFVRYNMSLRSNVTISGSFRLLNKSKYKTALQISGMDKIMKEKGWNDSTMLGTLLGSGIDISPGHWQRLAIARTIYRDRPILIMDEPFTFIDEVSRKQILDRLFEFIGSDRILIYITRESQFTERFDRVYKLEKGLLKEIK